MNMITATNFNDALWRKASRSTNGPDCVEITFNGRVIGVRDSRNPTGPILIITPSEWTTFLTTM
jgi:hypothetical protein